MQEATSPASSVGLSAYPSHLAHVKKSGIHHIICGALSPDGSLLAFSDIEGVRCYRITTEATQAAVTNGAVSEAEAVQAGTSSGVAAEAAATQAARAVEHTGQHASAAAGSQPSLQRLSLPEGLPAFQEMQFRPNSTHLLGLTPEGKLLVVDYLNSQVSMLGQCNMNRCSYCM